MLRIKVEVLQQGIVNETKMPIVLCKQVICVNGKLVSINSLSKENVCLSYLYCIGCFNS